MKYFKEYLEKYKDKKIRLYIDMDGVVTDYDLITFNPHMYEEDVFLNKRPVQTIIDILEEISHMDNIELYILSVSKLEKQIDGKLKWLDKYMKFIKKENINIIPKDINAPKNTTSLKVDFLKEHLDSNYINMILDDSHNVLETLYREKYDIIPLHTSSILD